ncbi:MAG: hypothetical protein ACFE0Q_20745 [Anaerolineae bacterium]
MSKNPQPGTLSYQIIKRVPVAINAEQVTVIITDGTQARAVTQKTRPDARLDDIPHGILAQLWRNGQPVSMRQWRQARSKQDKEQVTSALDTIIEAILTSAEPDPAIVTAAARDVLQGDMIDQWRKINAMLQQMDDRQLKQFLSVVLLITLHRE